MYSTFRANFLLEKRAIKSIMPSTWEDKDLMQKFEPHKSRNQLIIYVSSCDFVVHYWCPNTRDIGMRPINSAEHRKARLRKHRRTDMNKTQQKQAGGGAYLTAGWAPAASGGRKQSTHSPNLRIKDPKISRSAERVIWNRRREPRSKRPPA